MKIEKLLKMPALLIAITGCVYLIKNRKSNKLTLSEEEKTVEEVAPENVVNVENNVEEENNNEQPVDEQETGIEKIVKKI